MTEKEQEILGLYLKDLRKKRLIIVFIIVCVIIIGGASAKKYLIQNNVDIVSNENITQENVVNDVSNNTKVENVTQKTEEKKEETKDEGVFADGISLEENNGVYSFVYYNSLLPVVQTGNETNYALLLGIAAVATIGIIGGTILLKKKEEK